MDDPPKRYFINKLFHEDELKAPLEAQRWKPKIIQLTENIRSNFSPSIETQDESIYTGTPGVVYLFYCLIKSPLMEDVKEEFITKCKDYMANIDRYVMSKRYRQLYEVYGFLLGRSGYYALASAFYSLIGDNKKSEEFLQKFVSCVPYSFEKVDYGGNELFIGRSGYLMGALWLSKELQKPVLPIEKINEICCLIVIEGRMYSRQHSSVCPLMYAYHDTEYIGAAHGISSILFILLCCEDFLSKNPQAEEEIHRSVDTILLFQTSDGNFNADFREPRPPLRVNDDHELVHWCHGGPGVIYLMAKAYLRWKDDKYLESCVRIANLVWEKGLLKKGPGICHGVSGNGYVFLLMFRLTQDEKYLRKASAFALFMTTLEFRNNARTPDAPNSLYEGSAGALCYLLDLINPNRATFPFMDVF